MYSEIIQKYFSLTDTQIKQVDKLLPLYQEWNNKINVISRKDIDALYLHHVLHSMSILKFYDFVEGSEILDLGTGGGFPGIPLAIMCPKVDFLLIDGTQKKLKVVQSVVDQLELKNVIVKHIRAEYLKKQFDMVVTRAVSKTDKLLEWGRPLLKQKHINAFPNGIIALKGGLVQEELRILPKYEYYEMHPIADCFEESYFDEKFVVYIQG